LNGIQSYIKSRGVEYIRIDGSTTSSNRQQLVQQFQTSSQTRVAILSITAAGIALTLTAASTIYFAEMFWTPGSIIQAEDRAHRIGQTCTVNIYYFLADGTVDELIWPMIKEKFKILGEIVEGKENDDLLLMDIETGKNPVASSSSSSMLSPSDTTAADELNDADENNPDSDFLDQIDGTLICVNILKFNRLPIYMLIKSLIIIICSVCRNRTRNCR
jgi:SWI/SNF-related matrix-associated actin-dependent regulator 1 of chromatin subfamily A